MINKNTERIVRIIGKMTYKYIANTTATYDLEDFIQEGRLAAMTLKSDNEGMIVRTVQNRLLDIVRRELKRQEVYDEASLWIPQSEEIQIMFDFSPEDLKNIIQFTQPHDTDLELQQKMGIGKKKFYQIKKHLRDTILNRK